jgi:hypothetical protein
MWSHRLLSEKIVPCTFQRKNTGLGHWPFTRSTRFSQVHRRSESTRAMKSLSVFQDELRESSMTYLQNRLTPGLDFSLLNFNAKSIAELNSRSDGDMAIRDGPMGHGTKASRGVPSM